MEPIAGNYCYDDFCCYFGLMNYFRRSFNALYVCFHGSFEVAFVVNAFVIATAVKFIAVSEFAITIYTFVAIVVADLSHNYP